MRILVIGSSGQLGKTLVSSNKDGIDIFGAQRNVLSGGGDYFELDIQKEEAIGPLIASICPDVVINAAAMTDVDACERDPLTAVAVNSTAPRIIAKACKNIGARMIQVSTDYVFDGKEGMYVENATPSPIQEYGRTKLEGERGAMDVLGMDLTIIRTSVVFSDFSKNFVSWVMESLLKSEPLKIVNDQFVTPTSTDFLSDSIFELILHDKRGIWNVCSSDRLSRYDMANVVANVTERHDCKIFPISMSDLEWYADRPADSSLDCRKSNQLLEPKTFEEMVRDLFSIHRQ